MEIKLSLTVREAQTLERVLARVPLTILYDAFKSTERVAKAYEDLERIFVTLQQANSAR